MTQVEPLAPAPADERRRALPSRRRIATVCALVAGVWLVLDQATKQLAVEILAQRTIDLGFMDLRLVYNPGGAFGFPGFPGLFVIVTVVVVALVVRALPRTDRLSLAVAYGLVVGGALGNVVDRILRPPYFPSGEVVDFFDLRWWPVFNIADVGIVTGAVLIFLLTLLADRDDRAEERRRAGRRSVRPDAGTPQG